MKILYKNASIFYEFKGHGPLIVFLHGFLEDRSMWDSISSYCKDVRALLIDLPGHGASQNFDNIYTMDEMALIVKAILDEHQITAATFIGHSMGGYVCLAMAEHFPEYLNKLILVNSTPLPDSAERLKNRRQAIKLLGQKPNHFLSMAIQNLFASESLERLQPTIDQLKLNATKLDADGLIACIKGMMARPDRSAVLTNLKVPKTVIASLKDPIINCNELAKLSLMSGAQFAVIPGGHMSLFEQPILVGKLLHYYFD